MNIPEELKYTTDHEWLKIDNDTALIGITDFAQGELGDIVFLEIESLDEDLNKEGIFGTIEAVKTVSDLFMPVSGKVLKVNNKLDDNPEIINQDPYGDGWMVKIQLTNLDEINELMSADEYKAHLG